MYASSSFILDLSNFELHRYVKRKAREEFRAHMDERDPVALSNLLSKARSDLKVVERQSVVYSMYGRKQRSIMVSFQCNLQTKIPF
jgi:hypothetical protein